MDKQKILELFDNWNTLKKKINFEKKEKYPKHKEIWYINIWKNIWFEADWKWNDFKRPFLILKQIWILYLVVAMTTIEKKNKYYYKLDKKYFNKNSFIVLSQFRTIDKKRFVEKIWKLDLEDFEEIKEIVKSLF